MVEVCDAMLRVVIFGTLGIGFMLLVAPDATAWLLRKEGAVEHVGHVLLLLASLAWLVAAVRRQGRERLVCVGLASMCALVLGEELDWGGVLGWWGLAKHLIPLTGSGNLHNALDGNSYLLFAIPPLWLIGVVGWRRGNQPGRLPRRSDAIGFVVLGALSMGLSLLWLDGEPLVDEASEILLIVSLLVMAVRPCDSARDEAATADAPRSPGSGP